MVVFLNEGFFLLNRKYHHDPWPKSLKDFSTASPLELKMNTANMKDQRAALWSGSPPGKIPQWFRLALVQRRSRVRYNSRSFHYYSHVWHAGAGPIFSTEPGGNSGDLACMFREMIWWEIWSNKSEHLVRALNALSLVGRGSLGLFQVTTSWIFTPRIFTSRTTSRIFWWHLVSSMDWPLRRWGLPSKLQGFRMWSSGRHTEVRHGNRPLQHRNASCQKKEAHGEYYSHQSWWVRADCLRLFICHLLHLLILPPLLVSGSWLTGSSGGTDAHLNMPSSSQEPRNVPTIPQVASNSANLAQGIDVVPSLSVCLNVPLIPRLIFAWFWFIAEHEAESITTRAPDADAADLRSAHGNSSCRYFNIFKSVPNSLADSWFADPSTQPNTRPVTATFSLADSPEISFVHDMFEEAPQEDEHMPPPPPIPFEGALMATLRIAL